MNNFFNKFRVHLHFAGKGKYIMLAVLAVYFLIGSARAESIADILDDDQIQYIQEHKNELWAKELVSLYDAGTELLNLDFYNGIKSYISYMRDSDAYMDDMLGGGSEQPQPDPTDVFELVSYSKLSDSFSFVRDGYNSFSFTRNQGNFTVGSDSWPDTYFWTATASVTPSKNLAMTRCDSSGITVNHYFYTRTCNYNGYLQNNATAQFRGGNSQTIRYKANFDTDVYANFSGNLIESAKIVDLNYHTIYHVSAGQEFYLYFISKSIVEWHPTDTAMQLFGSASLSVSANNTSVPLPAPVDRPSFDINSFMPPNIYNYPSSSSAIYNYDNSIYNDIVNNYYTNEKNMDVQEVIAGRGDYTPELDDTVDILTYPLDVFKSMMSAIKDGYTGNFYLHINNVTWHDMTLLPQIDVDIDPRSILGDFFNFLSYVMLFGLTFPWIMHLYSNVRMLVGGGD